MIRVRVFVTTRTGSSEHTVQVVNRSQHALAGAIRAAWRRFPSAVAIHAEFVDSPLYARLVR